jgi:hypothetical protein
MFKNCIGLWFERPGAHWADSDLNHGDPEIRLIMDPLELFMIQGRIYNISLRDMVHCRMKENVISIEYGVRK